jgi:catechol 2,3-dioxygenase-like lactoylglutathione lyase family enzyme
MAERDKTGAEHMEWKLEVVPVPVTNVDRSIAFYRDQLGFALDLDIPLGPGTRVAQLTPTGSGCSIQVSYGVVKTPPGMIEGLQLVVPDIEQARAQLLSRGVDVSPVRQMEDGNWVDGHGGDWNAFLFFSDPDGNGWIVQERPAG